MFNIFDRPKLEYNYFDVIESDLCLQSWQLDNWTKELMGSEWVNEFDKWAEHNLPKQPTCYVMGNKLITHPSVAKEIRDKVAQESKFRYRAHFDMPTIRSNHSIINTLSTVC